MCRFLHIRNPAYLDDLTITNANKGGKTIAYDVNGDILRYAVAHCSDNDNFCRKTGRTLAAGRLKSDRLSHIVELNGRDVYEILTSL